MRIAFSSPRIAVFAMLVAAFGATSTIDSARAANPLELNFWLSGPRYEMKFHHPDLGLVELKGEKSYDLANLKESLTVCPLTVFQQGEAVGYAEVAYRDSILAFPLQSLRLVRAEPRAGFQ